jgi:limonene-1,2-epoxide hydrolase
MATTPSTTERNLALAREYNDRVFNSHQPELAAEYFTPDVKWHGGSFGTIEGPENVVALLQGFIGGLPDLHAVEEDASRRAT